MPTPFQQLKRYLNNQSHAIIEESTSKGEELIEDFKKSHLRFWITLPTDFSDKVRVTEARLHEAKRFNAEFQVYNTQTESKEVKLSEENKLLDTPNAPPRSFKEGVKKFIVEEGRKKVCFHCEGDHLIECPRCKGSGRQTCPKCGGTEEITVRKDCPSCGGSGTKEAVTRHETTEGEKIGQSVTKRDCIRCGGSGSISVTKKCPKCTRGYVSCGLCSGRGEIICPTCDGAGELSEVNILKMKYWTEEDSYKFYDGLPPSCLDKMGVKGKIFSKMDVNLERNFEDNNPPINPTEPYYINKIKLKGTNIRVWKTTYEYDDEYYSFFKEEEGKFEFEDYPKSWEKIALTITSVLLVLCFLSFLYLSGFI